MTKTIAVLGSINYDIVASAARLPVKGETVFGSSVDIFVGGQGANQAVQATLLGARTFFIGCTGTDMQGDIVRAGLQAKGVDIRHLAADPELRTGCASIYVDPNGDNMLVSAPGANHHITKQIIDGAAEAIRSADIFISQNEINPDAILYGLKKAHEAGVKTVLNPSPAIELDESVYPLIDYIIPNETESEVYTGILRESLPFDDWKRASAEWFLRRGVKNVCITLGANGAYYMGGGQSFDAAAFPIVPVDTTAAGDSFCGGFVYGLLTGLPTQKCLLLGNACGALTATNLGAQSSISNYEKVTAFLKERGVSL